MKKINLLAGLAVVTALTACGGGSGGGGTAEVSLKQSDIEGLWNTSELGGGVLDEAYIYLDSNGVVHPYDYLGDAFDQGPNCYYTDAGSAKDQIIIDSAGNSKWYTVVQESPLLYADIIVTIEMLNNGNILRLIAPDYWDEDDDGNIAENTDDTYPKVTNLTTDDMPPCTEQQMEEFWSNLPAS